MYARNYKLLNSKFREFLFPIIFTSMAGNISIFVDSIIVSIFVGAINLSVMQIIEPVSTLINLLYWMIGLGGSLLCSILKAEFNEKKSLEVFTSSIVSMVLIGIIIALFSFIFSDYILGILCTSSQLKPLVSQYFIYYVLGIPFLSYMMAMSYFIRVDGFLRLPFISLVISNAFNLILDIVLIHYFNMGLQGAALATTSSYIIGSLCMSTYFIKKGRTLRFVKVKISSFVNHLKDICRSGYSTASTQLYLTIKLYVLNIILANVSGAIGLASFNMCYNTLFIISIFIIGISQSMSPIVSVYYKEMDYHGVDYVIKKSAKLMIVVSLAFVALFTLYPQVLLLLFKVNTPEYVSYIMNAVRIFSLSYLALGINFLYIFYAQAIQKDKLANIIQILEGLILPISAVVLFMFAFGDFGIWISFFITEILVLIFLIAYSRYINRKTNGEYTGFFINKHNDDEKVFEHTINGDINEAVNLSREVQNYLSGNKSATLVSMAIEEMLVNIININEEVDTIDIIVRNNEENILISVKDTGIDFNPVIENEDLKFDNISVLNKIADKIDYSRVLGLNSTVITIKN